MAGADKTVIKGFCEQILSLRNHDKPLHLLLPWQAWFLCGDIDYFLVSVYIHSIRTQLQSLGDKKVYQRILYTCTMYSILHIPICCKFTSVYYILYICCKWKKYEVAVLRILSWLIRIRIWIWKKKCWIMEF